MDNWFDEPIILKEEEEYTRPKTSLFDFLNDISYAKSGILTEDNKKDYSPYMVNRFLSMDIGTLLYAQEMNSRYGIEPDLHYDYLLHSLRKMKRYFKYIKGSKDENIELLADYYNVNKHQAKQYLKLHSNEDIKEIEKRTSLGGVDGKKKSKR